MLRPWDFKEIGSVNKNAPVRSTSFDQLLICEMKFIYKAKSSKARYSTIYVEQN